MLAKNLPAVLLVEDSPDDVDFARRALAKSNSAHRLVVAEQGEQALEMLRGGGLDSEPGERFRPALVLLDLNIPGMSGHELLRQIKTDDDLCSIPVVILSTSHNRKEIESCYRDLANSYHVKLDDFGRYQNMLARIVEYWLEIAQPAHTPEEMLCEPCAGPES